MSDIPCCEDDAAAPLEHERWCEASEAREEIDDFLVYAACAWLRQSHKGPTRDYRSELRADQLERFDRKAREKLEPECARWLETGVA